MGHLSLTRKQKKEFPNMVITRQCFSSGWYLICECLPLCNWMTCCSVGKDAALYYYEWAAVRGHVIAALLFAHFQSKGTVKTPRNMYMAME